MGKFTPQQVASARAAIQRVLDRHKRLDFKSLEAEIRTILDDPGASYHDVVDFFAACGLMVRLDSVHEFCIPRNIRPPAALPAGTTAAARVLRRRSGD